MSLLQTVPPESGLHDDLPTVSLVVPCWNDAESLRQLLEATRDMANLYEVVVADASRDEASAAVARGFGARVVRCPKPNRGAQLNAGAGAATGDVLLFHHVDVPLTDEHLLSVRKSAAVGKFASGAFYRQFDHDHVWRRWMEPWVRFYNRHFGALYGDQSLFISKETFAASGGFREMALMEDVEFTLRLRRSGGITMVDPPVRPSARRHRNRGSLKTTTFNLIIIAAFRLGVSPDTLHRWYYGNRSAGDDAVPSAAQAPSETA